MPKGTPGRAPCSLDDCDRPHYAHGVCHMHRRRFLKHGSYDRGRVNYQPLTNKSGYVLIWAPDHPDAYKPSNRIPEHRLVMEGILGRRLLPGENVHHRNGVRNDNRPENLELWISAQPKGQRVEDLLEFARGIIETYGGAE